MVPAALPTAGTAITFEEQVIKELRYNTKRKVYELSCDRASNHLATSAGFIYDGRKGRGVCVTASPTIAMRFAHYANTETQIRIAEGEREAERQRHNSSAYKANLNGARPEGLDYFGYQAAGIKVMLERPHTLLGDEMGLGKTIQAIGIINCRTEIESVLIITPASLKLNWERELRKWLTRSLSFVVATPSFYPIGANIVIINYELVKKYLTDLSSRRWDCIIGDEFHYCKNKSTQRTKAVTSLEADYKIALTGTAIENKIDDLYPCLHWMYPDWFPSERGFVKAYKNKERELNRDLRATVLLRRLKKDVLTDLPPKTRQVIELPADGVEAIVAAEMEEFHRRQHVIQELRWAVDEAKEAGNHEDYKKLIGRLNSAVGVMFTEMAKVRKATAVAKAPFLLEHIKNVAEQEPKAVIFAHHHEVIDKLVKGLDPNITAHIDGRTSQIARDQAVERFQEDDTCRFFVGGIEAAGVGLTLTASRICIFGEMVWKPSTLTQAEDRIHRIGQKGNALIQHVVLEKSLDLLMAEKVIQKQDLIDKALNNERQW